MSFLIQAEELSQFAFNPSILAVHFHQSILKMTCNLSEIVWSIKNKETDSTAEFLDRLEKEVSLLIDSKVPHFSHRINYASIYLKSFSYNYKTLKISLSVWRSIEVLDRQSQASWLEHLTDTSVLVWLDAFSIDHRISLNANDPLSMWRFWGFDDYSSTLSR